jgi:hypothetical protein
MKNSGIERLTTAGLLGVALLLSAGSALAQPKVHRPCNCATERCLVMDVMDKVQAIVGLMTLRTGSYMLNLDSPVCGKNTEVGQDDFPGETIIHVIPAENLISTVKALMGQHVRMQGYPFAGHTAWHRTNIMFEANSIERAPQ